MQTSHPTVQTKSLKRSIREIACVRWYTLSHAGHGDRDKAFILEDASYGAVLALSIDRVQPRFLSIKPILEILRHWITQWVSGKSLGRMG